MWAHTTSDVFPFQTAPGVYDERGLKALDFVLETARKYGLQVILSFIDNWKYYNGVDQVGTGFCFQLEGTVVFDASSGWGQPDVQSAGSCDHKDQWLNDGLRWCSVQLKGMAMQWEHRFGG